MRTTHSITAVLAVIALASLAAPRPAAAADCGGDYLSCLYASGAVGTSDALHDSDCYASYLSCVGRQILMY